MQVAKYSSMIPPKFSAILPESLPESTKALIMASITSSSWNKHASALKCYKSFEYSSNKKHNWPLSSGSVQEFISWALSVRKLKPNTITSYISTLIFIHNLQGMNTSNCTDTIAKAMLRGATNLEFYSFISRGSRKVMTFPLLKLLSHQIAISSWEKDSKQVFWTAVTIAFFGSFRFGELLATREGSFNPFETLLWSDITFKTDSVVIGIKIPKSRNPQGEYVDLFEQKNNSYCAVKALRMLKVIKVIVSS